MVKIGNYPELALRTLSTKEFVDQKAHMIMGIAGEFMSEVVPLLTSSLKNKGELEEELGDMCWYIGCYCILEGIEFRPLGAKPLDSLEVAIGELLEMHKKNYAYGKELDFKNQTKYIQTVLYWVYYIADQNDIAVDSMLTRNIEKLRVRYPEKFDSIKAIERVVSEEKKVFTESSQSDEEE